jgi:hypothetical protein
LLIVIVSTGVFSSTIGALTETLFDGLFHIARAVFNLLS